MFGPDDFEVQIQQENPPGIHAEPSIPPAQDEEYGDFIVKHGQNMGGKFLPVNELFGILYIPLNEIAVVSRRFSRSIQASRAALPELPSRRIWYRFA